MAARTAHLLLQIALLFALGSFSTQAKEPAQLDKQIAAFQVDVPRAREILQLVIQDDDQPTKQIHDEFWGLVLTTIRADPEVLGRAFAVGTDRAFVLQRAFWKSMRASALAGEVTFSEEFTKIRNDYRAAEFTADYKARQDEMLAAAASGKPYKARNGQLMTFSKDEIDKNLRNISGAIVRIHTLCDPNWH